MSDYLTVIEEETRAISDTAQYLKELSKSFSMTGNTLLGESLYVEYQNLMDSQKNINKAVSVEINDRFKQSEQSAFNTVAACLAMSNLSDD